MSIIRAGRNTTMITIMTPRHKDSVNTGDLLSWYSLKYPVFS